jgi:hypothetical protein
VEDNDSDELKQIEKEIQEDFERTDREIEEAKNYELKGWEKWDWLAWGIFCCVVGAVIIFYLYLYGGLDTCNTWALYLLGGSFLVCGILSFIFRDSIFWMP